MKPRWILFAVCLGLTGCFGPRTRLQSADEGEIHEAEVRTIGDVTTVATQDEITVFGVGLIVGLNGTGGGAPPASAAREALENDLKKKGVRAVKAVLESPNCAMVILSAHIPTSARKNDPVDIEISLPEMSRCTSLKGGYLTACELFNYESSRRLGGAGDAVLKGSALVKAEGPIITGITGRVRPAAAEGTAGAGDYRNEEESAREGKVWGGGKCQIDPPMMLVLNQDQQSSRVAAQVSDRINQTFPGMKFGRDGLASAKNKSLVTIGVPLQYRTDVAHYLRVLRAIPLHGNPPPDGAYRRKLAEQLLDPSKCLSAAIRLEALGEDSVPALRPALNAPLPLTRFAAARALTYLRKRDGVEELARLARQQPALRGLCLTALSSLDESVCHNRLAEMMSEREPELRYGAFCGLRKLDDHAPEIAGEKCKDAYFVHQVAPDSEPLVHYLTGKRTEIVLFGRGPALLADLRFGAGDDFTFATSADGKTCTIKRFSRKNPDTVGKQCSTQLIDVLKALAEMGGGYADAVDLLNKADANGKLNCELRHDALPRTVDVSQLARAGKDDPTLRTVLPAGGQ